MKQKAICPFCKKENETLQAFEVDSNEEFCYCPICGKKIKTKDAADNFVSTIRNMVRRANYQVHIAGKFEKAYRNFGDILSLQPENPFALTGRALSLMLMSTLRYQKFDDALTLINFAKHELRKQRNQITYFEFLSRTQMIIRLYIETINDRLTYKEHFYDEECIKLFYSRAALLCKISRLVSLEIENLISKGLTNSRVSEKLEETHRFYNGLNRFINSPLSLINGNTYKCKLNDNNTIETVLYNEKGSSVVEPKVIRSLNEKEHKGKIIRDKVFKARRGKFLLATSLMAGVWIFALLGAVLITLGCLIPCNQFAMFITAGVSFALSVAGLVTRIFIKRKIRTSKLLNIAVDF